MMMDIREKERVLWQKPLHQQKNKNSECDHDDRQANEYGWLRIYIYKLYL